MDDLAGSSKVRQPPEPSPRQITPVPTKQSKIGAEIKRLAEAFAATRPSTPQLAGHKYFVGLCLGKTSNFYDIGRYFQLCFQHNKMGIVIDGQPCNKISFITPPLSRDKLLKLEGLWIDYDGLGASYNKCGRAPKRLSEEAFAPEDSDASSSPTRPSLPFLVSSPAIPFSSLPLPAVIHANSTPNRKRRRSSSEAHPSTSKRIKYFDLTKPREQSYHSDYALPSPYMKTVIDLTGSDVGDDLQRARALRRERMRKRLAGMVYGGSLDID